MFELFSQHFEGSGAENRAMGKGTCTCTCTRVCNPEHSVCVTSLNIRFLRSAEMAVKYFHLAEALYYRILESIIEREKMILGNTDLSVSIKAGIEGTKDGPRVEYKIQVIF